MALTTIAGYRQAGHTIDDEDFHENANLQTSKFGTRTLFKTLIAASGVLSAANIAKTDSGVFGGLSMSDGGASSVTFSFRKPTEYVSGDVVLRILWNTAATSNDLKLTSKIKSATTEDTTASGATDSGTATADGTANDLNELTITIAAADFNANEFIGLEISRDPTDGADTLSADAKIFAICIEYTGRG